MGLLDGLKSAVRNTVSSAANAVGEAVGAVEDRASQVVQTAKDEFQSAIPEKAAPPAAPPPGKSWYSGVTDAFSHTEAAVKATVAHTVQGVERAASSAATAVSDAGRAVEHAGQQVIDSGRAVIQASEKAVGDVADVAKDAGRVVSDAGRVAVDAGRAAYHAGSAALTGNPKELDAAQAAITHARSDIDDAHSAVTDAQARVADVGTQAGQVSQALTQARSAIETAREKLVSAGDALGTAASTVAAAPRELMEGVSQAVAQGGAEVKQAIERDVPGGKDMLAGLSRYAEGAKDVGVGLLTADPFKLAKGVREEAGGLTRFGQGLVDSPAGQFARAKVTDYANGFNVDKQVKDLQPGDTYSVKIGANVHVEVGGEVDGSIEVSRARDGGYEVKAAGEVGINGYLEAGGHLGPLKAGADAEAHGLLGGNLTLKCDTAEEAQRATHIFEKLAAKAALSSNPATAIAGAVTPGLSKEDTAFLKEHTTGLELSGSAAGEAGAALGIDKGPLRAGVGASLGLNSSQSIRIDLDHGKPTGVTVTQAYGGELSANGGVSVGLPAKKPEAPKPGEKAEEEGPSTWKPELQGKVEGTLTVETHYDFPKDVSAADLQKDPLASLKKFGAGMQKSATVTATVELEGEGKVGLPGLQKEGHVSAEVAFTGKPSEVLSPEALEKALRGDYAGAARQMGSKVEVEGSVKTFDDKKWGVEGLGASVLGVGLEGTFQAERRHDNPPFLEIKGNGTEVATRAVEQADTLKRRAFVRG